MFDHPSRNDHKTGSHRPFFLGFQIAWMGLDLAWYCNDILEMLYQFLNFQVELEMSRYCARGYKVLHAQMGLWYPRFNKLDRFNVYMLIRIVNLQEGDRRNEVSQNFTSQNSFLPLILPFFPLPHPACHGTSVTQGMLWMKNADPRNSKATTLSTLHLW